MTPTRLLLSMLAACQDTGVTVHNAAPTADITSHEDGDAVLEGSGLTLTGTVGDADETAQSSRIRSPSTPATASQSATTPPTPGRVLQVASWLEPTSPSPCTVVSLRSPP